MTACGYCNKIIIFNNGEKCRRMYKIVTVNSELWAQLELTDA